MATRTSHSSPCFLRVADASAASRASKMTSLSTPFSLETASTTIRISLFTPSPYVCQVSTRSAEIRSGCQPRFTDLLEPDLHFLPVHFELDPRRRHGQELARIAPPPVPRRSQFHEHARAHEPLEVRGRAQQPVEAGRGHLERVRARYGILDIEESRYITAHALTVLDPHAFRPVYEQPHDGL